MTAPLPPRLAPTRPAPAAAGAQAVQRALSLLSLVGRGGPDGLGLGYLTAASGLSRPTVRRLLLALAQARLVEQDAASRRYHLGPEAHFLAGFATPRHGLLTHAADSLRRLAAETGDTALLSVQQDDHVICLHREEGSFPIRTHALKAGDRNPIGVGAGSLAILAALPEAESRALRARIAPLLRDIPPNPGRVVPGSWGIGVALRWSDGRPAGALSIAAIEDRMTPDRQPQLVALLRREATLVETRLAQLAAAPPQPRKD